MGWIAVPVCAPINPSGDQPRLATSLSADHSVRMVISPPTDESVH